MADGALKAAQDAVNQIKSDAAAAPVSAPDAATADALAAVQAALNEVNNPTSGGLGGGAVSDDGAADAPASFALPGFSDTPLNDKPGNIDLLADVNLNVKIELGRTRMFVEDVLRLGEGSVVELDKLAGDPVDIYVNERHVARGEVLVLNDNFCIRVNEIISPLAQEEAA
jgi:flagellar motor switch protein FliN/FliY